MLLTSSHPVPHLFFFFFFPASSSCPTIILSLKSMVSLHGHGSPPCPSAVNYSRGPVTGSRTARRGCGWHGRSCIVAVRLDHGVARQPWLLLVLWSFCFLLGKFQITPHVQTLFLRRASRATLSSNKPKIRPPCLKWPPLSPAINSTSRQLRDGHMLICYHCIGVFWSEKLFPQIKVNCKRVGLRKRNWKEES